MKRLRTCPRQIPLVGAAVLLALAAVARPAAAQKGGFENTVELYLMGASMAGTLGTGPLDTTIDVPSSDVFENLKFAALADYRGQSRSWAVLADVVYMNLGGAGSGSHGLGSADVSVEELVVDFAAAARVTESFELLVGARYTELQTTVELYLPRLYREESADKGWVDPFVGFQAFLPLAKDLQLQVRGDLGGFGVGCDFTWQATMRLNWEVSRKLRVGVGYRWLDQAYESGSGREEFKWDVLTQGPLVAAGVKF